MIKNKAIAHYIAKVTGKEPSVQRFNLQKKQIDILSCVEHGDDKLHVHSTIGLSGHSTNEEGRDIELILLAYASFELAPNVLAGAALRTLFDGWQTTTGAVFANIFSPFYPDASVKHGLIIPPYLWKESLKNLDLGDRLVEWKMLIPLTDSEVQFLLKKSPSDLLPKFVEQDLDLFDLNRVEATLETV